ncbi:Rbs1p [Lachancea thermotolerans CBS 6340]|uniref:KLTH0H02288p n=1 Tax=Lachancea thermotolerans (strain ATCC 56472 / CBS 6340 / NRRL Y-8284) TaxID=559295 RepID=C5E256_LACTC|nr:KLTH0H02288p [Lachancea thermotolerans CBS 6340]CAR30117.1 KLTH0H02288p [Lachancea thermotolerans CBS 6340]
MTSNNGMAIGKLTPALVAALFERAHDKQFIIQLENSMVEFMGSPAEAYQLEPMNSYYRLLAHHVAEYHGLGHSLSRNNDACVVVFKGETFLRDKSIVLLQNLDPSCVTNAVDTQRSESKQSASKSMIAQETRQVYNSAGLKPLAAVSEKEGTRTPETPSTPKKPIPIEDDSPQPHQFETSRYRFRQQSEKPRRRKNYKGSTNRTAQPVYFPPPPAFPVPYMLYNPYPMMFVPPERQFSQFAPVAPVGQYPNPNPFIYGHPAHNKVEPYGPNGSSSTFSSMRTYKTEDSESLESLSKDASEKQEPRMSRKDSETSVGKISDKMDKLGL